MVIASRTSAAEGNLTRMPIVRVGAATEQPSVRAALIYGFKNCRSPHSSLESHHARRRYRRTGPILANEFLTWIGFGTLSGLAAKAIMPGRDPGGAVATLLMGVGGAVIGGGVLMYFTGGQKVQPISIAGFGVATGGAFVLLFFYRLLNGRIIKEAGGGRPDPGTLTGRRSLRRRRGTTILVDE